MLILVPRLFVGVRYTLAGSLDDARAFGFAAEGPWSLHLCGGN